MDRWALFVAVLALAFTAYSFFRQHWLQQRLAAIEQDRRREEVASSLEAEVGARFESYPSGTTPAHENYQLVLSNAGQARAEDVTVELVVLMGGGGARDVALEPRPDLRLQA